MHGFPLDMAFTLIEPGPVILVTTNDGGKPNVMTISWTMAIGFGTPGSFGHRMPCRRCQRGNL